MMDFSFTTQQEGLTGVYTVPSFTQCTHTHKYTHTLPQREAKDGPSVLLLDCHSALIRAEHRKFLKCEICLREARLKQRRDLRRRKERGSVLYREAGWVKGVDAKTMGEFWGENAVKCFYGLK